MVPTMAPNRAFFMRLRLKRDMRQSQLRSTDAIEYTELTYRFAIGCGLAQLSETVIAWVAGERFSNLSRHRAVIGRYIRSPARPRSGSPIQKVTARLKISTP